ncbi:hypothetical protein LENED_003709 [Lentinula edodes]|uniref:Uncharacterized protein n=1 Tax=Lentinula edodes TaxID=5353 RepID=A0A1Q3E4W4_LENED|nr:hypothetical protein LENED_003709 [Lentinula edodes]
MRKRQRLTHQSRSMSILDLPFTNTSTDPHNNYNTDDVEVKDSLWGSCFFGPAAPEVGSFTTVVDDHYWFAFNMDPLYPTRRSKIIFHERYDKSH